MITIVSGLPRSGTSMMMLMLEAGGMQVLADGSRPPDDGNPAGYYEYAKVKDIEGDSSWIGEAEGKALKVVSMGLYHLPPDRQYRIVFMVRRMRDVLASQAAMLRRDRMPYPIGDDADMALHFAFHLRRLRRWLKGQANLEVLYVRYDSVVAAPLEQAAFVCRFLGRRLDTTNMAAVMQPRTPFQGSNST